MSRASHDAWSRLRTAASASRRPDRLDLLAVGIFLLIAVALTWPFAIHPGTTVIGPIGYDVTGDTAKWDAIVQAGRTPFASDPIPGVSEPGGLPSSPWLDAASIERTLFLWLGTLAFGSIAAHGLLVVTGYLLSGTALYLLVRRLTGSPEAGIVGGIAGAFSSHLLLIARAAPEYVHIWFYVLPLWRFIELGVRPSARNSVLAGLAILPAMFWTPYFAQHVLVLTGAAVLTLAVLIGRAEGRSRLPGALLPMIGIAGAGAVIYLFLGLLSDFSDVPVRDTGDFYLLSVNPLMYLVPGSFSGWGGALHRALVDEFPRALALNNYIGLTVVALGAWGVVQVLSGRFADPRPARGPAGGVSPLIAAVWLAMAGVVAALGFSAPPTVDLLAVHVPTPARLTQELVPSVRASYRLVQLVAACAGVLAGIGTATVLRGRPRLVALPLAVLLSVVIFGDLWARAPDTISRVPRSAALAQLGELPRGLAVHYQLIEEYPDSGLLAGPVPRPCLLRAQHGQPLVNTCSTSHYPTVLLTINHLDDCTTVGRLRDMGVRYVITDAGLRVFPGCAGRAALEVVALDDQFTVYEIGEAARTGGGMDGGVRPVVRAARVAGSPSAPGSS